MLLAACADPSAGGPKQTTGAAVGAVGGAILGGMAGNAIGGGGKNAIAIGTGAALGGIGGLLMGSAAGQSMDRADRMYAERSWSRAMVAPVGQEIVWENPDTGNRGHTVATRQGRHGGTGDLCREYTTRIQSAAATRPWSAPPAATATAPGRPVAEPGIRVEARTPPGR